MAKILVVEDEPSINDLIALNLKLVGYQYKSAYAGDQALEYLRCESFDLVLLDVLLPNMDGFELMEHLKILGIPTIFITAKDSLSDRIKGFELGAEDYILKPFEVLELLARIKVVLRRNHRAPDSFVLGTVNVLLKERKVFDGSLELELTAQEYALLETLIENKNIALSREKLLELAWGYDYEGDTRTVDVHIRKLRQKLGWEDVIKTVYKIGYRLEAPR